MPTRKRASKNLQQGEQRKREGARTRTLLLHVLRDLQNAALRFEHEFFLVAQ